MVPYLLVYEERSKIRDDNNVVISVIKEDSEAKAIDQFIRDLNFAGRSPVKDDITIRAIDDIEYPWYYWF